MSNNERGLKFIEVATRLFEQDYEMRYAFENSSNLTEFAQIHKDKRSILWAKINTCY